MSDLLNFNTLTMGDAKYCFTTPTKAGDTYVFKGSGGIDKLDHSNLELYLERTLDANKYLGSYKITCLRESNPLLQNVEGGVRAVFDAEKKQCTLHPTDHAAHQTWFLTRE